MAVRDKEDSLRNPGPGTAAARDFGIDLTLVIEQLRLTPEQRIRRLDGMLDSLRSIKAAMRKVQFDKPSE